MEINRENYEEYFSLYADNELTDSEKADVLLFIRENQDLMEEFRMMHYTVSKPDSNVAIADKSFLYKNESGEFINEKNFEEIFVRYHDNELTEAEKLATERFLSLHPGIKNDFEWIGLARMIPGKSLKFPDKRLLYKGEKPGKILPLPILRIISAAVFVGVGLWFSYSYFKPQEKSVATAIFTPAEHPASSSGNANTLPGIKPPGAVANNSKDDFGNTDRNEKQKTEYQKEQYAEKASQRKYAKRYPVNKQIQTAALSDKIDDKAIINYKKMEDLSIMEIYAAHTIEPLKEIAINSLNPGIDKEQPVTFAKPVAYLQEDKEKNDNYAFYDIPAEEFSKTRVGGFLKKVKRVIERNNPVTRLFSGGNRPDESY